MREETKMMSQTALLELQGESNEVAALVKQVEKSFNKIIQYYAQERWHTSQLKGKLELYNNYITASFSLLTKYKKMLKSFQSTRREQNKVTQLIARIGGTPARQETLSDSEESEDDNDDNEYQSPKKKPRQEDEATC